MSKMITNNSEPPPAAPPITAALLVIAKLPVSETKISITATSNKILIKEKSRSRMKEETVYYAWHCT